MPRPRPLRAAALFLAIGLAVAATACDSASVTGGSTAGTTSTTAATGSTAAPSTGNATPSTQPTRPSQPCNAPGTQVITGDTAITHPVGTTFVLGADVNAGTGYVWRSTVKGAAVTEAGSGAVPCGGQIGAEEISTFTYTAASPGNATIVLTETGPGQTTPTRTYTVTVTVT